jgi:DNA-binding transcriptional LysR family regulator
MAANAAALNIPSLNKRSKVMENSLQFEAEASDARIVPEDQGADQFMDHLLSIKIVMADLDLLRTFLAIYRTGSVTAAARTLDLTQPAVTSQLKAFEASLGRALFTRLPRGMAPTPAAHALASSVAVHLDTLEAVVSSARSWTGTLDGTLLLGGPGEFLAVNVLPALATLTEKGVRLQVQLGLTGELLDSLAAGRLDLVIATIRTPRRDLEFEALCDEEFVLVAGPAWAARLPRPVIAKEGAAAFDGVPLVAYADDLPIIRRYFRAVFHRRIQRAPAIVVPDLRAVLAATVAGAGVTVLPRYLCVGHLARGELMDLHPTRTPPTNTLYLARRTTNPLTPRAEVARQLLRQASAGWRIPPVAGFS